MIRATGDNAINLSFRDLMLIGTAITAISIILYLILPIWAFFGLVVGATAGINILCAVLAAIHFLRPSK